MRVVGYLACVAAVAWVAGGARPAWGQVVAERVGDRVVRFHADESARAGALPSMSLDIALPSLGRADGFAVSPRFSTVAVVNDPDAEKAGRPANRTRHRVEIDIAAGTSLYGTGSVTGPMLRNGRIVETWNFDNYGYTDPALSLYQSHPWVLAVRADGSSFGVLADTTYRTEIDLSGAGGAGIRFTADGPAFPVIVIERGSPQEVVVELTRLTGRIEMPPKWAIGYHQCRYSYNPDARVREIVRGFRERRIPADVIWMDIDYMHGFRTFTFDPQQFPDPAGLNRFIRENGMHAVWMINPGVKVEPGYFVYDQLMAGDHAVRRADGSVYQGEVWPGMCVFPDFTRASTREWWAGLYADFMATGVDGVWNDMNEPAIFNVPTKTMPESNLHRPDPELRGPEGADVSHMRFHNVYGMMMVRATREGVMRANPDRRPFVLSRANFIGGNKFAAMWSGDNTADWPHLEESVPGVINMGLSGQPFNGPDIGGFAGNGPAGQEGKLFARWMGFGALLPFARGHTGKGNIDKEPWSFGPEVEATSRQALERRYRLLPYLYTLFHEAHTTGMPIVRPVFFADPADPALRSEDDAFLLGADLLVFPRLTPDGLRSPTMPRGTWRRFDWGEGSNPDLPDMYLRGGAIVPTGPVVQFVGEKPLDELTLLVALDGEGRASGVLYEDAGDGWAFRDGEFRLSRFEARSEGGEVVVRRVGVEGRLTPTDRRVMVRLIGAGGERSGSGTEVGGVRVPAESRP